MLLGLRITNFEVLRDLRIGLQAEDLAGDETELRCIGELNAVIGENAVGKTSLFRSLEFLRSALTADLVAASTKGANIGFTHLRSRHCKENMSFELVLFDRPLMAILIYKLAISADKHGRPRVCAERVEALAVSEAQAERLRTDAMLVGPRPELTTYLRLENGRGTVRYEGEMRQTELSDRKRPALASYGRLKEYKEICALYDLISSWYFSRFTDLGEEEGLHRLRDKHRLQLDLGNGEHHHINEEGSNIANVLAYMKRLDPVRYSQTMQMLVEKLSYRGDLTKAVQSDALGSGEYKLLALFLLLMDPEPRSLLFIENPDHGLYYNMIDKLAEAMRDYIWNEHETQIFLSTHSQNLLESLAPREVWVMHRSEIPERGSHAINAEDLPLVKAFYDEGVGMSALWYSGHLDIRDLEGE